MEKKDLFSEMEVKAIKQKHNSDYVRITTKTVMVKIGESRPSRIKNALILVKPACGNVMEWRVENQRLLCCPQPFILCLKNLKNVALCLGEEGQEDSYYILRYSEEPFPQNIQVIGVVENEDNAIVFYIDGEQPQNYYVREEKGMDAASDLYFLMKKMKEVGGMFNGRAEDEGLQWQETWEDAETEWNH